MKQTKIPSREQLETARRPLLESLEDFIRTRIANGRDEKYVKDVKSKLEDIYVQDYADGLSEFPSAVGRRMQPKPRTEEFQSSWPNLRYRMGTFS